MSVVSTDTLVVQDLSVPFGTRPGLHKASLRVASGERVVIVGPSGAGKTSLLRAIAGLTGITHGSVAIGGRDVTQLHPEQRGAVYMHQTPLLFPHLNVYENVAFPLRVRGVAQADISDRVHDALVNVQLDALASRAPETLSGGQLHRAALARAVVGRPALLLLDEPFSSLDPSLREEVRDALVALQEKFRLSVLLITHDIDEASRLADRIGVLKDGGILQMGTPAEMFEAPASPAIAVALGRRAILDGTLNAHGELRCALGVVVVDAAELPEVGIAPGNAEIGVLVLFLPGALSLIEPLPDGPVFQVQRITYGGDGATAQLSAGQMPFDIPIPASAPAGGDAPSTIAMGAHVSVRITPSRIRLFRP
ncbi:MAG: ABC transporter ATP-binding protein [Gemmatimonadaceae bacterium]